MAGGTGMDLIFGLACDGRAYPDFPGEGAGALHAALVGPSGLVELLEVHLGLTGPRSAEAVRIAAYAAKLRAALSSDTPPFFAASFSRDPWATAKALLGWRDQLVAAGWKGQAVGALRIDDLARSKPTRVLPIPCCLRWPAPPAPSPKPSIFSARIRCRRFWLSA